MTINIKDLTGQKLKKALGLYTAVKSYHNKNKSGGNFAVIMIRVPEDKLFELSGEHDLNGNVYNLSVGSVRLGEPIVPILNRDNYQYVNILDALHMIESYMNKYPKYL